MDLRIVKTKKAIKENFLKLREKKDLNEIHVTTICELAMINKSTFYKYYLSIEDLSDKIINEIIESFFNNFKEKNELFTNPQSFFYGFSQGLANIKPLVKILFNQEMPRFFIKIENEFLKMYNKDSNSDYENIMSSFAICGALHTIGAMKFWNKYKQDIVIENLSLIIKSLNIQPK